MTAKELAIFMKEQFGKRMALRDESSKARVYPEENQFIPFSMMASVLGISAQEQVVNLVAKHFVDVSLMVSGKHPLSKDSLYMEDLIFDIQNYLDILMAMTKEICESGGPDDL